MSKSSSLTSKHLTDAWTHLTDKDAWFLSNDKPVVYSGGRRSGKSWQSPWILVPPSLQKEAVKIMGTSSDTMWVEEEDMEPERSTLDLIIDEQIANLRF